MKRQLIVTSIIFVLFLTGCNVSQKNEINEPKNIDITLSEETNNHQETEYIKSDYIITTMPNDIITITSPDLNSEKVSINDYDDSINKIKKGIANLNKGTLINTIYETNKLLVTNYDYNHILPSGDLRLESATHELLYKYYQSPEIKVYNENGKTNIECFGNLKKCYINETVVGLVFISLIPQYEGMTIYDNSFYVDLKENKVLNFDREMYETMEPLNFNCDIKDFQEFDNYIFSSDKIIEYDDYDIIIKSGGLRGHEAWLDVCDMNELVEIYESSNGKLRIYSELSNYYINGNIISFLEENWSENSIWYDVRNVDIANKKIMEADDLIEITKSNKEHVKNVIKNALIEEMIYDWPYHHVSDEEKVVVEKFLKNVLLESDFNKDDFEVWDKEIYNYTDDIISFNNVEWTNSEASLIHYVLSTYYEYIDRYENFWRLDFYLNENAHLCIYADYPIDSVGGGFPQIFFYDITAEKILPYMTVQQTLFERSNE
ncbi:MAG: hypothetical protein IJ215_02300 [Clostridia bacterium]|nr:hypothetical protein [Clostridia bacterium]